MENTSDFEHEPLTGQEYITALAHFYRGELGRSVSWRERLDATTNWSILTAAGMISFTFTNPANPHLIILVSNLAVLSYLFIEARRYRYFEVYRARVRMLEENFLIPLVSRRLASPESGWREALTADLDSPRFKTTILGAMAFRLRRNYAVIFAFVLGGWLMKIYVHPAYPEDWGHLYERIAIGAVPPWLVLALGTAFYASLALLACRGRHIHGDNPDDEVEGLERHLENWKL